jgi:hypothetical protein
MADNFVKNIQIIAKTDELSDKLDKLYLNGSLPTKGNIVDQRISAYQDGSGATNVASGATAGANGTTGTGVNGTPVTGPLAPPPIDLSQVDNAQKAATDAALKSSSLNNTSSSSDGSKTNDLSSKAKDPTNGGGGTPFADQGQLGENNPDWLAIKNAMIGNGATDAQIKQARLNFLKKELGIDDIGDVVKGDAGAKPTSNNNSFPQPDANSPANTSEKQNGFTGADPVDHTKSVLIRFDGVDITPSAVDAALANQYTWQSGNQPPVKQGWQNWQMGKFVTGSGTYFSTTDAPTADLLPQASIGYHSGSFGYNVTAVRNVDTVAGTFEAFVDWTGTSFPGNTGWASASFTYSQFNCSGMTDACPSQPQRETSWPVTGVYAISWLLGKVITSGFDSEVPSNVRLESSTAKIHSLVTGQDYYIEPSINGGHLVYDTLGTDGYFLNYNADNTLEGVHPNTVYSFYTPRKQ